MMTAYLSKEEIVQQMSDRLWEKESDFKRALYRRCGKSKTIDTMLQYGHWSSPMSLPLTLGRSVTQIIFDEWSDDMLDCSLKYTIQTMWGTPVTQVKLPPYAYVCLGTETIEATLKSTKCWPEPFGVYPEVPWYYKPEHRHILAFAGSRG